MKERRRAFIEYSETPIAICPRCGLPWYEYRQSDSFWYEPRYQSDEAACESYPLVGGGCAVCAVSTMSEEKLNRFLTDPQRLRPFVTWLLTPAQYAPAEANILGRVYELFRAHDHDLWLDAARTYADLRKAEALDALRAAG